MLEFYTDSPNMPKTNTFITISDNILNWQIKYSNGTPASKINDHFQPVIYKLTGRRTKPFSGTIMVSSGMVRTAMQKSLFTIAGWIIPCSLASFAAVMTDTTEYYPLTIATAEKQPDS